MFAHIKIEIIFNWIEKLRMKADRSNTILYVEHTLLFYKWLIMIWGIIITQTDC